LLVPWGVVVVAVAGGVVVACLAVGVVVSIVGPLQAGVVTFLLSSSVL
jgi:hypothetical protein